jgi:hypothetical protein
MATAETRAGTSQLLSAPLQPAARSRPRSVGAAVVLSSGAEAITALAPPIVSACVTAIVSGPPSPSKSRNAKLVRSSHTLPGLAPVSTARTAAYSSATAVTIRTSNNSAPPLAMAGHDVTRQQARQAALRGGDGHLAGSRNGANHPSSPARRSTSSRTASARRKPKILL